MRTTKISDEIELTKMLTMLYSLMKVIKSRKYDKTPLAGRKLDGTDYLPQSKFTFKCRASFNIQIRAPKRPLVFMLIPQLQYFAVLCLPGIWSRFAVFGPFPHISQHVLQVDVAPLPRAVLIKTEEIYRELLQFLGYQAKTDSSNSVGAIK